MAKIHLTYTPSGEWPWWAPFPGLVALCGRRILLGDGVDASQFEDNGKLNVCLTCKKVWDNWEKTNAHN